MNPQKLEKILQLQTYGMYYLTCYLWAKFFEDNNMAWVYCPESGRDGMVDEAADFTFLIRTPTCLLIWDARGENI